MTNILPRMAASLLVAGMIHNSAKAVVVYSDQESFLSDSSPITTEDFESYPLQGNTDSGGVTTYSFADFSLTANTNAIKILDVPHAGNHNTTAGGSQYLAFDTDTGLLGSYVTFSFEPGVEPIHSFGLYFSTLHEPAFVQINGETPAYSISVPVADGETYFGIISAEEIFSIRIDGGATDSHWSIDDVSYGSTIPEPSVAGLIGVAAIGLILKRKQKAKPQRYGNQRMRIKGSAPELSIDRFSS